MDPSTRLLSMGAAGAAAKTYVEDVFSTFLYTGNGSTQTITNGIDLSGKGGLVWLKRRDLAGNNILYNTTAGTGNYLSSNTTTGNQTYDPAIYDIKSFNNNGFTLGEPWNSVNNNGNLFTSWTFRKEPGFFDVVTYTGNGSTQTIAHSLGSTPGCIIIKRTDSTSQWFVYHRSADPNKNLWLDSTSAEFNNGGPAFSSITSTSIVIDRTYVSSLNNNGATYVAYLFAHDAQLFGDGGNQSVIKCGSYTGNGSASGPTIDLGWEPQWVMIKVATTGAGWFIFDTMRGIVTGGSDTYLRAESASEDFASFNDIDITSTGFQLTSTGGGTNQSGQTFIYIAIRRGPMKTPTDATKVFDDVATSGATGTVITTGFPVDWQLCKDSRSGTNGVFSVSRLTGVSTVNSDVNGGFMRTSSTAAESQNNATRYWDNTGYRIAASQGGNSSIYWNFSRAPGFFDVVAYTGTGSARTVSHNLGVAPELMIVKSRSSVFNWLVYTQPTGNDYFLSLNNNQGINQNTSNWNATTPTSSVFSLGATTNTNGSGSTYIAYLFASCPGVSKVGSYTGTGTTLSIDCGFTAGARFVLIKRTDSTGDWYVWDTARGIIAADDPYLLLNSTAAEVTNTDYIDPLNSGFQISSTAPAAINASGGSFIFLAIA